MSNPVSPSPALAFDTINAHQKTAVIKAAIELQIFTHIASGADRASEIAARCDAAERGIRILCDTLTVFGFLNKTSDTYQLTAESAAFLDAKAPAYIGGAVEFLLSPLLTSNFDHLTSAVRKGGTSQTVLGTIAPDHPIWIQFARAMGPMMIAPAHALAQWSALETPHAGKVLDISASHGMWGISLAQKHSGIHLVALDWAPVLEVTRENADRAGLADRFTTIPGNAFEVDLGSDYDIVLIPNFLHHFNTDDCIRFLTKVHAALKDGGRVAIVEFVPNADRVTPPDAARFALVMLVSTPEGDAYTAHEYESMLKQAGFKTPIMQSLPPSFATAIVARK